MTQMQKMFFGLNILGISVRCKICADASIRKVHETMHLNHIN